MLAILADVRKYEWLDPLNEFDNSAQNETKLQRRLLYLVKSNNLPKTVDKVLRPFGSQRPKMYGLPKIQNKDVHHRPILSMIGSAQHELAKFLAAYYNPYWSFTQLIALIILFLSLK